MNCYTTTNLHSGLTSNNILVASPIVTEISQKKTISIES